MTACRRLSLRAAVVTVGLAAGVAPGLAAVCALPISDAALGTYVGNPRTITSEYPHGGDDLAWRVRLLASAGVPALRAVTGAVPGANRNQKRAIGLGLALAANACVGSSLVGRQIQESVRNAADADVRTAYINALSDTDAPTAPAPDDDSDMPQRKVLNLDGPIGLPAVAPNVIRSIK